MLASLSNRMDTLVARQPQAPVEPTSGATSAGAGVPGVPEIPPNLVKFLTLQARIDLVHNPLQKVKGQNNWSESSACSGPVLPSIGHNNAALQLLCEPRQHCLAADPPPLHHCSATAPQLRRRRATTGTPGLC